MDSKIFFVLHFLGFVSAVLCQQNLQNHQQTAQVVQPSSDVNPDRTNQPVAYDYTYLTKPYGYSAYRAYDQGYQPQQAGYTNGYYGGGGSGYGTSASTHGSSLGLFHGVWPLILLPFLIFFGLTFFFPLIVHMPHQWGSRQSPTEPTDEASFIIQSVVEAVESNKCLQKTACEMGLYARQLGSSKSTVLQYVEKFAPPTLAAYIEILKESAKYKGEEKNYCDKYICSKEGSIAKPQDDK